MSPNLSRSDKLSVIRDYRTRSIFEDQEDHKLKVSELCWTPHYGQAQVLAGNTRFKVVGCGRRWGKTVYGTMTLIEKAMIDPGPYLWAAPFYSELTAVTTVIDEMLPRDFIKKKAMTRVQGSPSVYSYIVLPNDSTVSFRSTDRRDSLRGDKYKGAVLDEAPTIKSYSITNEIMPSLMDYAGWALFIGSPKGRGLFYHYYMRGQDRESHPNWESWQQPSYMNTIENGGYINLEEINIIAQDLPLLARRQEILAQFIQEEGQVFRNIDAMIGGSTGPAEPGRIYSIGCDLGKTVDYTVLTALDQTGLVRGWERFNIIDWSFQRKKIKNFYDRYPGYLWIDSTGLGSPVYDELRAEGIQIMPYTFTTQSKKTLVEKLQISCDMMRLRFPHDLKILHNEMKAFEYKFNPRTKNVIYGAPETLHDDCVYSLGLANHGLRWAQAPAARRGRVS